MMKLQNFHNRTLLRFALLCLTLFLISTALPISAEKNTYVHDEAREQNFIYTLHLTRLHPDTISSLERGAHLIDKVTKQEIGRIVDISHTPHMAETYSADDDCIIKVPHPFYLDVTLTVRAIGRISQSGCQIGAFRLIQGIFVSFSTPKFSGVGECTAYELVERT